MLLSAITQHIARYRARVGWIPSGRLAGPMLYTTQISLKGQLLPVPLSRNKGCALGQDRREVSEGSPFRHLGTGQIQASALSVLRVFTTD